MVSEPTSRAVGRLLQEEEEEEEDEKIAFLPNSIADSDVLATLGYFTDKNHSRNTVSYPKSLRIQALKVWTVFKCITP